ncbi:hypothetical protein ACHWQZ_G001597 [Mnemiopsis leidyi]
MSGFDVKPLWKVHRVPLPLIDMTRPKNLRPLNLKLKEGSSTVPDENTLSNSTISSPCITPTSFTSLEPADTEVDVKYLQSLNENLKNAVSGLDPDSDLNSLFESIKF